VVNAPQPSGRHGRRAFLALLVAAEPAREMGLAVPQSILLRADVVVQ
jgi:hypothetical protein